MRGQREPVNAYYQSPDEAVVQYLREEWAFVTRPDLFDPKEIGKVMLNESLAVFDEKTGNVCAAVSFRPACRNESRLPVAIVVDFDRRSLRTETVEQAVGA